MKKLPSNPPIEAAASVLRSGYIAEVTAMEVVLMWIKSLSDADCMSLDADVKRHMAYAEPPSAVPEAIRSALSRRVTEPWTD